MAARRRSGPRPGRSKPPGGSPGPAALANLPKISASLIEFARPLVAALPQPPTIEQMRHVMQIAMIAWNLPLLEDEPGGEGAELRALYERQMNQAPAFFRAIMDELLRERRARWGHDPRVVASVDVIRKPDEFRIVATASLLQPKSLPSR